MVGALMEVEKPRRRAPTKANPDRGRGQKSCGCSAGSPFRTLRPCDVIFGAGISSMRTANWSKYARLVLDVLFDDYELNAFFRSLSPSLAARFSEVADRTQRSTELLASISAGVFLDALSRHALSSAQGEQADRIRQVLPLLLGKGFDPANVVRALAEAAATDGYALTYVIVAADELCQTGTARMRESFEIVSKWISVHHEQQGQSSSSVSDIPLLLCWEAVRALVYKSPWSVDSRALGWSLLQLVETIYPLNLQLPGKSTSWIRHAHDLVLVALERCRSQTEAVKGAAWPSVKALEYLLRQTDQLRDYRRVMADQFPLDAEDAQDSEPYLTIAVLMGQHWVLCAQGQQQEANQLLMHIREKLSEPCLRKSHRWLSLALRLLLHTTDIDVLRRVVTWAIKLNEPETVMAAYFRLAELRFAQGQVAEALDWNAQAQACAAIQKNTRAQAGAALMAIELRLYDRKPVDSEALNQLAEQFKPNGTAEDEYGLARVRLAQGWLVLHGGAALRLPDLPKIRAELELARDSFKRAQYRPDAAQAQWLLGQSFLKEGELLVQQVRYQEARVAFAQVHEVLSELKAQGWHLSMPVSHREALDKELTRAEQDRRRADVAHKWIPITEVLPTLEPLLRNIEVLLEAEVAEEEDWWRGYALDLWNGFYSLAARSIDEEGLLLYTSQNLQSAIGLQTLSSYLLRVRTGAD